MLRTTCGLFTVAGLLVCEVAFGQRAIVSASGRVEGQTPTIRMGFSIAGTVADVYARPGDFKRRGEQLIALGCEDRRAQVQEAQASIREQRSLIEKIRSGSRAEERAVYVERVQVAKAELQAARTKLSRAEQLTQKGNFLSPAELDAAGDSFKLSNARVNAATAELNLIAAPARPEDLKAAEARLSVANAKHESLVAEAEKCILRAPADVRILRTFVDVGDLIAPNSGTPAVSLVSTANRRVRAEIDERDVGKIRIGQAVAVGSEFNPALKLRGKVAEVMGEMGRRSIKGVDPSEKNDRDVLEALIDIENADASLPVGFRVTVVFSTNP